MRAVAFERHGGPEVLRPIELPKPEPGPGQVLIRVAYAGVNFAEVYRRLGVLEQVDGATVPGLEVSGHVEGLGEDVEGFAAGERVAALTHPRAGASGGYAEFAIAPTELVFPLDSDIGEVDLRAGAALPCAVTTAYGVLAIAGLGVGDSLLVHAAAGGVGSIAAQIARARGVGRLLGTVGREAKLEAAARYGYDRVYLRERFRPELTDEFGERSLDVVLDSVAGRARVESLESLAPLGRLVVFGNAGRDEDIETTGSRLWLESRAILGYNIGELAMRAPLVLRRHALAARDMIAAGDVSVDIAEELPLDRAEEVHRLLEGGSTHGKLLLAVAA